MAISDYMEDDEVKYYVLLSLLLLSILLNLIHLSVSIGAGCRRRCCCCNPNKRYRNGNEYITLPKVDSSLRSSHDEGATLGTWITN